jgi:hypothetical protein
VAGVLLALALATGNPADAALEEFESWSVGERERDDENGLDELHRAFAPWEDWRWRRYRNGSRVGMGCATTETWEVDLDVKLRHPLGARGEVGFRHRQRERLGESVTWSEYNGAWRARGHTWLGATYRPSFDKEQHDAGLFVRWERDSTRWIRLHLGFEDVLNDFWEGHTRHVREKPRRRYGRRPVEVELSGLWLGRSAGIAARAVWLPECERTVRPPAEGPAALAPATALELAGALLELDAFVARDPGLTWGLRTGLKRADRTDRTGDAGTAASLWPADRATLRDVSLEPWLDVQVAPGWRVRPRGLARWSRESHRDDLGRHTLETRHLGGVATATWSPLRFLNVELGLAAERVRVRQAAHPDRAFFTHGSRTESRVILALELHGPGFALVLFETLELDDEGYQGVTAHDKGFARLIVEF